MEISPLQRKVSASDLSLEQMEANKNLSNKDKLSEVCRQFEAVLLRQILSESQKNVIDTKHQSAADGIYHDMVTNQMADSISRSRAFGLATTLEKELGRQLLKNPDSTSSDNSSQTGSVPKTL